MASVIHATGHGLSAGSTFRFGNVVPEGTGVDPNATYYVLASGLTADDFEFSTEDGGTAFVLTLAIEDGVLVTVDSYTAIETGPMAPTDPPDVNAPYVGPNLIVESSWEVDGGAWTYVTEDTSPSHVPTVDWAPTTDQAKDGVKSLGVTSHVEDSSDYVEGWVESTDFIPVRRASMYRFSIWVYIAQISQDNPTYPRIYVTQYDVDQNELVSNYFMSLENDPNGLDATWTEHIRIFGPHTIDAYNVFQWQPQTAYVKFKFIVDGANHPAHALQLYLDAVSFTQGTVRQRYEPAVGDHVHSIHASDVSVADDADYFVGTDVEAVLAELGASMGGGGGTPATTVTDETTFGITPAVGTDTEYARQDHTHGSPDDPTAGYGDIVTHAASEFQPIDSDLTAIAALTPTNDDIIQRKAGAWTNRTIAQLITDLALGSVYQPLDSDLTALAGLAVAADTLPYGTGSHTMALATFTAFARSLLDDVDAAAMRTTLGLVPGTDVQAYDAELAAIAGLTSAANKGIQFTGSGTAATYDLTAAGKALLDDADAAAQRTTLGLGSAATSNTGDFDAAGAAAAAQAASQPLDSDLTAFAALAIAADKLPYGTGSHTLGLADFTAFARTLLDDADAATMRTTLGLGTAATHATTDYEASGTAILKTFVAAKGDIIGASADDTPALTTVGTNGQKLRADSAQSSGLGWVDDIASLNFIIDGGGAVITTGVKGYIEIPFGCTITAVRTLADASGSIVVDIWKDTYANYPPTVADTITASAKPTLASAQKAQDTTLTGWTTSIAAGDILGFNVDSASTVTRVTVSLTLKKT